MRKITPDEAGQAYAILIETVGASESEDERRSFIRSVASRDCREYRFMGHLGFGGKFRNNGNFDDTPYVDCYGEHRTKARERMIAAANARLAALFTKPSPAGSA